MSSAMTAATTLSGPSLGTPEMGAASVAAPHVERAGWIVLAGLAICSALIQLIDPLPTDYASLLGLVVVLAGFVLAGRFYEAYRPRPHFAAMFYGLAQATSFSGLAAYLTYQVARYGGPLMDAELQAADLMIGFVWLDYAHAVDAMGATVVAILKHSYASLIPQTVAVVLILGLANRRASLAQTMLAAMLAGAACVALSPIVAAESNFVYLGLDASDFRHIDPFAGLVHIADYRALRDGSFALFTLGSTEGIVTFPSYHAALSAVLGWGFLKAPLWARPIAIVSLLTIIATPIDGGHYLVDVIAGLVIAGAALWAARLFIERGAPASATKLA